jgi:hypothetical protein
MSWIADPDNRVFLLTFAIALFYMVIVPWLARQKKVAPEPEAPAEPLDATDLVAMPEHRTASTAPDLLEPASRRVA